MLFACRFGDNHLRAVWRLSLGLGIVPALAVFIWRLNMEEPSHYKKNSMARAPTPYLLILRRYWKEWLGIALTWFIYDFITYVNLVTPFLPRVADILSQVPRKQ